MRCVVVAVVVADTFPSPAAAEFAQFVVGFSIVFVAVVVAAAVVVATDDDDDVVVVIVVVIVGIFSRWFRCKSVNGFVVELCPVVVVPFAVSGVVVAVAPVAAAIVVAVSVVVVAFAVALAYLMHLLIKSRLRHISLFNFSRSILLLNK